MIAPPRPPSHGGQAALIREARARQRRRRLLGAAGVTVATAIGLGVYAITGGGSQRATTGGSPSAAPPLCSSSQLSATVGFQGATGSLLGAASIENTSGAACSLPRGRPTVVIASHGATLRTRERIPPHPFPGRPAHVLAPGAKALVWMQWFNWCGKPSSPATFDLRFPGGLVLETSEDGEPRCDSSQAASTLYVSRPLKPQ